MMLRRCAHCQRKRGRHAQDPAASDVGAEQASSRVRRDVAHEEHVSAPLDTVCILALHFSVTHR